MKMKLFLGAAFFMGMMTFNAEARGVSDYATVTGATHPTTGQTLNESVKISVVDASHPEGKLQGTCYSVGKCPNNN